MKKANLTLLISIIVSTVVATPSSAARYTFTPRLDVDSYYTDNLDLTPDNEESDIVTSVVPGFTAGVSGRTAGADLTISPGYTFYNKNSDLDYWNFSAGLDSFVDIARNTRATVTDSFYLTRDPNPENLITDVRANDPGAFVDPTVRQGRDKYWQNDFAARVDHQFGLDKSVFAGYGNSILRNDSDQVEDSDVNTGTAGLTYFWDPKWGSQLEGGFSRRTFDQNEELADGSSSDSDVWTGRIRLVRRFTRETDVFSEYTYGNVDYTSGNIFSLVSGSGQPTLVLNEDYSIHDVRAGANYAIDQDLLLNVSAGWAFKINDVSENQDGGVFDLALRKTLPRGGFRVEAGAGYDIGGLSVTAQNYGFTRYYRVGATGDYQIFRLLYGDIYGNYRHNKYIDTIPERDDDEYLAGVGCTWRPYRWGSIRLGYAFRKIDSEISTFSYTENRILLSFSISTDLQLRSLF